MANYDNRDPYNLTSNSGRPYDEYGNSRFEPVEDSGRGPYILLALLVAIGVIGGLLYFNHKPIDTQQAQAPITADHTAPGPAAPGAAPLSGSTATPNNPGGMTGPSSGGDSSAPATAPGGTH